MLRAPMLAVSMLLFVFNAAWQAQAAQQKPNVLFIFMDDLGWKDVGYNGAKFFETPNIDQLAREGLVFDQAYVNGANCAPSRACLISGQYTPRHKVYAVGTIRRGPDRLKRLDVTAIPEAHSLPANDPTIADALRSAGYATCCIGKWHLGNSAETLPTARGFDKYVAPSDFPPFKKSKDPKHVFAYTDAALEFIKEHRERPWFVYLAHNAIHTPLEAKPETIEHFRNKASDDPQLKSLVMYAACLLDADQSIGRLLQGLKALGEEDETLVVFFSDNGATGRSPQQPLRGHKGMYYEGGIRVPLIIRWPGVIKPGHCKVPVCAVDFYPTFLELAGVPKPQGKILDGKSLVPLLLGKPGAEAEFMNRPIFWHFPGYLDRTWPGARDPRFRTPPVTVVRLGDWKLHLFHEEWVLDGGWEKRAENNAVELYNLAEDVSEQQNLANKLPDKRDELLKLLLRWVQEVNAPIAQKANPAYRSK